MRRAAYRLCYWIALGSGVTTTGLVWAFFTLGRRGGALAFLGQFVVFALWLIFRPIQLASFAGAVALVPSDAPARK